MDALLVQALGNIVSDVVIRTATWLWQSTDTAAKSATELRRLLQAKGAERSVRTLIETLGEIPDVSDEIVDSPEFERLLINTFVAHLLGESDSLRPAINAISARSLSLWCPAETRPRVVGAVDAMVSMLLGSGNKGTRLMKGNFADRPRWEAYAQRMLLSATLVPSIAEGTVDASQVQGYQRRLRLAMASATRMMSPPTLGDKVLAPIDELYVEPSLVAWSPQSLDRGELIPKPRRAVRRPNEQHGLSASQTVLSFERVVVLGDPGAGKTSLSAKLAHDVASGQDLKYTPIIVLLRDYGQRDTLRSTSLVQFIEKTSDLDYSCPAPANAVGSLLESGRLLVIFDGLDELLDTAARVEVTKRVDAFASRYPAAHIVVTSRRQGYREAPLDQNLFEHLRIAPFDNHQVERYARTWFDRSCASGFLDGDPSKLAKAFLEESASVGDLRDNPLMLALLCNLYRNERYLPANRADVYEKCSVLLFEKWDKSRNIVFDLPIDAAMRPALQRIAWQIFTGELSSSGATSYELQALLREFLSDYFESAAEAKRAAETFARFFTGRAWVFSEVGTKREGERLLAFTHRTFLEYFAAMELVSRAAGPDDLVSELQGHIEFAEWEVVAQLAVQVMARGRQGAADRIIHLLSVPLGDAEDISPDEALRQEYNLLEFSATVMQGLLVSLSTVKTLARRISEVALALLRRESSLAQDGTHLTPEATPGAISLVQALLIGAGPHHRRACLSVLAAALRDAVMDGSVSATLFALNDWCVQAGDRTNALTPAAADETRSSFGEMLDEIQVQVLNIASHSMPVAVEGWRAERVPATKLADDHSFLPLILNRRVVGLGSLGRYLSLLEIVLHDPTMPVARRTVEDFGPLLRPAMAPFISIQRGAEIGIGDMSLALPSFGFGRLEAKVEDQATMDFCLTLLACAVELQVEMAGRRRRGKRMSEVDRWTSFSRDSDRSAPWWLSRLVPSISKRYRSLDAPEGRGIASVLQPWSSRETNFVAFE